MVIARSVLAMVRVQKVNSLAQHSANARHGDVTAMWNLGSLKKILVIQKGKNKRKNENSRFI